MHIKSCLESDRAILFQSPSRLPLIIKEVHWPRESCKKQLVGITTFEVAMSVVGLAADLFSLCVQERSQTLTGQPGDHAHWVKRVSSLYNIKPPPLVMILSVVVALW